MQTDDPWKSKRYKAILFIADSWNGSVVRNYHKQDIFLYEEVTEAKATQNSGIQCASLVKHYRVLNRTIHTQ